MKIPPSQQKVTADEVNEPLIEPKAARNFLSRESVETENAVKQICLKISESLLSRCDAAAKVASVTRSSYIKMALLEKLERDGK